MNELQWMTKAEFFEVLDRPVSKDEPVVFKQMHLFGPYYIQDLSFNQCCQYPKDKHNVCYKDRFPLYRMCDIAFPMDKPLDASTKEMRDACINKCKELGSCKGDAASQIRYEMAMFIKDRIEHRFDKVEEGVMQAYHPIVPYQGMVSRYEAEASLSPNTDHTNSSEDTDLMMRKIGPRICNPDLSDTIDMDYGFGTLGDNYNQSTKDSLDKACALYHLTAYSRLMNNDDKVVEGFQFFDNPDWVNENWDRVEEAILDATKNVPPSIPTVNDSLVMKEKDDEDIESSEFTERKVRYDDLNVDKFRQFLALHQNYQVSPYAFTSFMNTYHYDYIVGYINDGPVLYRKQDSTWMMPVIDIGEGNINKLLIYDGDNLRVERFPTKM